MKTKEKAEDLVDKFYQTTPNEYFVNEPIVPEVVAEVTE